MTRGDLEQSGRAPANNLEREARRLARLRLVTERERSPERELRLSVEDEDPDPKEAA